jgi:MFS-type transporter involved in bile tolerance (Atg22 family)
MSWEYLQYVTIYGMIVSIIFGYMDRPILEKRLLIGISICSVILFITSLFIDNQMFRSQAIYLFYGIVIGRKMVLFVDMKFKKNRKK